MGFYGANTDQLIEQARQCKRRGEQALTTMEDTERVVTSVEWTGPDADQFQETFRGLRAQWSTAIDGLHGSAESLATHAAEQDAVSDPTGSIDSSRYDGLVGGEFLDWSDVINGGERVSDIWRDPVRAGDPDNALGERYTEKNPDWDPSDIDTSEEAIKDEVMQQGQLGDCWFLAGLMAVQQTDPGLLADNITPKGDPPGSDGWTVKLYVDGEWKDVSVSPDDLGEKGARNADSNQPGVLSVYEQAMINASDGRASAVSADTPANGLEMITGKPAAESDTVFQPSFDDFKQAIDDGRPVTVMTDPIKPIGPAHNELVAAHVYQVSGYDASTGEIILTNPHGPNATSQYEVRVKPDDPRFQFDIFMTGIGES